MAERILGLDVGSRTIGMAVTDGLGMCAHGLKTLDRRGTAKDVEAVTKIAAEYQTRVIVVGLPYEMDGVEGHRAERVRVFGDALAAAGFTIEYWDERYSTVEAEARLIGADVSRAKRKQVVDTVAAQVILQGWLDGQASGQGQ